MLPLTDFPNNAEAQYPITPGPSTGIFEVPVSREPQYTCVNDQSNHGICRSGEKVFQPGEKCITCVKNKLPLCGIEDAQWQTILWFDAGILEMGDELYACVNASVGGGGGTCTSSEKVRIAGTRCSQCLRLKRSPGCSIQDAQYQIPLGFDAGIIEVPSPRGNGFLCANDPAYGGDCTGTYKVQVKGRVCDNCTALGKGEGKGKGGPVR